MDFYLFAYTRDII